MSSERTAELLRRQDVLARFGELALRSDDFDHILHEACHLVGHALGTDLAEVMELQQDGVTLRVRAGVGWPPGVVGHVTVAADACSSEGHALGSGNPVISPDIATETRFRYADFIKDAGVKALANVVIIGADERPAYGILQVDSRTPREFTAVDTAFLRGYANLIAAAVWRLRTHVEVRQSQIALLESEARFRTLAEGIPVLVWRSRSSGERTWGSPQWTAYSGLSERESQGFGWLDAVHPEDRAATLAAWADAEAKSAFSAEYRVRKAADGAYRWFQGRAIPVRDDGHIVEWLGTATDIDDQIQARHVLARGREELESLVAARTAELGNALNALHVEVLEREHAEDALRQSQKMEAVGRLTGGIAHDFNNMLQGIAGSLETALRRLQSDRPKDAIRYLTMAGQTVLRAAGLTRRLLSFARRQRLQPTPVDPDGLVASMADLIRRTVGPGIRVELNLRDGAWGVLCDVNELESTLLNLCINARDAMPDGGRLTVGTEDAHLTQQDFADQEGGEPGDFVEISVVDTGEGMPPDVLARVFEPFFTTKRLGEGTGLGLSQVYGFVRQSGGLVRLTSEPGHGTAVRLYLPRHERPPVPEPGPVERLDESGTGEIVLLVDDERGVREVAGELLRDLGYRVLEAEDGPAALTLLRDLPHVDLLVTDVGLPNGMNGRQVAERLRDRWPALPVLFITGYADTALPAGSEVIGKPFRLTTLANKVQAMLGAERSVGGFEAAGRCGGHVAEQEDPAKR